MGRMDEASSNRAIIKNFLESLDLDMLARDSGWSLKSRKVQALNWCLSLCLAASQRAPSLGAAAHFLGLVGSLTVNLPRKNGQLRCS